MITRCCLTALTMLCLLGCVNRPATVGDASDPSGADGLPSLPPEVQREFRGMWIATVANIDWPTESGLTTQQQKNELTEMLDEIVALGLNTVIFQVRTSADALYQSQHEPWSSYLTGTQGQAPDPAYDPLAFVIQESRRRGLELHAWINPLRASHPSYEGPLDPDHVSQTLPQATPRYGNMLWMDPGHPDTLQQTLAVVEDLVANYDLDGLHIDDYFYPYPQEGEDGQRIDFPDQQTFADYQAGGGKLSRDDWRRDNVNRMVKAMYRTIKRIKPHVKFGISPFGIWRPGHPEYVKGMDQYAAIYADAKLWLEQGWCDYFVPQLYWNIQNPDQSFIGLLDWWNQITPDDRHLYPGLYTSRTADGSARQFDGEQIGQQVRWSRIMLPDDHPGHVHFSMKAIMENRAGLRDSLPKQVYGQAALPPAMPWLKSPNKLRRPQVTAAEFDDGQTRLRLDPDSVRATRWITAHWKSADGQRWVSGVYPVVDDTLVIEQAIPASRPETNNETDAENAGDQAPAAGPPTVWLRAYDRLGKATTPVRVELIESSDTLVHATPRPAAEAGAR